jgi:dihydroorotate dehydrogenase (NAD+) catalytic subunit
MAFRRSGVPEAKRVLLDCEVGSVRLGSCLLPAAGTAGFGDELCDYVPAEMLGALVTKSLLVEPWSGNDSPRVIPTPAGMLNSVGLAGPGVPAWVERYLPRLEALGHPVVVSIWGRSVEEYGAAAAALAGVSPLIKAVEINLSCPNLIGKAMFAHDPVAAAEAVDAASASLLPRWAKLSANTDRLLSVAEAVAGAGAEAVVLINTMMGMAIDVETRRPRLGAGRGGLSGVAIHPIAVRSVWEVADAFADLSIVGVGGVSRAEDAVELLLAGADAVQVGTASFAEPRALARIHGELVRWCADRGIDRTSDLTRAAFS